MERTPLLTLLLALALVLSGCLGGDDTVDTDDEGDADDQGAGQTDGNETTEPDANQTTEPPAANTPPTADLAADTQAGDAPLVVTFSIMGDDIDGDALSWTLDADGDGTTDADGDTLPAEHTHNFTAAGNHTARLTVSDGTDSTEATLNVTVTAQAPTATLPDNITISDTITGLYAGVDYVAVEERSHNWSFDSTGVKNMTISVSFDDPTTIDLDWSVFAPDGTEVVARAAFNVPGGAEVPGVIALDAEEPAFSVTDTALLRQTGEWLIDIHPGESVEGGYTVTVTFA